MRPTFSFLSSLAYLCLLAFIFSCNQQAKKSNSNPASPGKINHQVTKKNSNQLKVDSTINNEDPEHKAYDNQPKIYLFFPSNDTIACKIGALPYTTVDGKNQPYFDGQTYLNNIDSAYMVSQLKSIPQLVVNPDGGTSFGNFDCLDSMDCLSLDTDSRIGILCVLKIDTNYICHLMLSHKNWYNPNKGIIALITLHGKILEWMTSDGGVTPGNLHGNIARMFTITSANMINIEEYAEGDNSDRYVFHASYQAKYNKLILKKRKLHFLLKLYAH